MMRARGRRRRSARPSRAGCRSAPSRPRPVVERLVCADEQLLAGLTPGVQGPRHLDSAEGAVVEQSAVLASERDALGDTLVDDVPADLGQAVDVGLPRAIVAPLDRVVEQSVDQVAVALVVLGGVDAALAAIECARRGESW